MAVDDSAMCPVALTLDLFRAFPPPSTVFEAMAVPKDTIWDRDPHTEAKHRVLAGYHDAWYPIMLSRFPRLTVFEGYAGPGVYSAGEDGSPVIAIRRLLERPELLTEGKRVKFVFVEERQDRAAKLRDRIAACFPSLPAGLTIEYSNGSCEEVGAPALTQAGAWGMPVFANLDPFNAEVPLDLVRRIGANPSSEVIVTFMSDQLRRWATLESLDSGDITFGSKSWRDVAHLDDPEQKELFLVQEYRKTLAAAGFPLTTPFRLSDEGGHSFYLIFGTRHQRGLERMKDSMWKIDPVTGVQFRDPTDPNQSVLDLGQPEPHLTGLTDRVRIRLEEVGGSATVEELRDFVLFETAFRPPHANTVVKQMLERNELRREPEKGQLSRKVRVSLK